MKCRLACYSLNSSRSRFVCARLNSSSIFPFVPASTGEWIARRATIRCLPGLVEAAIYASAHRLAVLVGEAPTSLLTELLESKPLPPRPDLLPVGVPSKLLRRRPDIRRTERELAEDFDPIAQRYATLPEARKTMANKLRALNLMMK